MSRRRPLLLGTDLKRAKGHLVTVWVRDRLRTAFGWSCVCGARFTADLPTYETAKDQADAHCTQARGGTAA